MSMLRWSVPYRDHGGWRTVHTYGARRETSSRNGMRNRISRRHWVTWLRHHFLLLLAGHELGVTGRNTRRPHTWQRWRQRGHMRHQRGRNELHPAMQHRCNDAAHYQANIHVLVDDPSPVVVMWHEGAHTQAHGIETLDVSREMVEVSEQSQKEHATAVPNMVMLSVRFDEAKHLAAAVANGHGLTCGSWPPGHHSRQCAPCRVLQARCCRNIRHNSA